MKLENIINSASGIIMAGMGIGGLILLSFSKIERRYEIIPAAIIGAVSAYTIATGMSMIKEANKEYRKKI